MIDLLLVDRFPTRAEADRANSARLEDIASEAHTYVAEDRPEFDAFGCRVTEVPIERLLERLVAPPVVTLKVNTKPITYCSGALR